MLANFNRNPRVWVLGHVSPRFNLGANNYPRIIQFDVVRTDLTHVGKYSYLRFKLVTLELSATSTMITYHRMFILGLSYLAFKLAALAMNATNTMRPIEANVHTWSSVCLPTTWYFLKRMCFCTVSYAIVMLVVIS